MTWEIVVGFLSLATAGIAIGKVIYELSRTLTKLNCCYKMVDYLKKALIYGHTSRISS